MSEILDEEMLDEISNTIISKIMELYKNEVSFIFTSKNISLEKKFYFLQRIVLNTFISLFSVNCETWDVDTLKFFDQIKLREKLDVKEKKDD